MRILLSSDHVYPASHETGAGREPLPFPSGSGQQLHDLLAKGLSELEHRVFYLLRGTREQPPPGVTIVSHPPSEIDICHCANARDDELIGYLEARDVPCVTTCHVDPALHGHPRLASHPDNWIYVSQTFAESMGSGRFVRNGLDPTDYIFQSVKEPYLFFISGLDHWRAKGLDVALELSRQCNFHLKVAGSARTQRRIDEVKSLCGEYQAEYLGDVRGPRKARLLSKARALLFPTRLDESFGLVLVEALMSGTPVITSECGACPEVVSPSVGFVCRDFEDYERAVYGVETISPRACRQEALRRFHYLRMTREYLREYEREIGNVAFPRAQAVEQITDNGLAKVLLLGRP